MSDVAARPESLTDLSLAELHDAWRRYYATVAPATMSRELLQRAIGYRMQEERFGGLNPRTLLRLKAIGTNLKTGRGQAAKAMRAAPLLKPGTKLIREWQGKVHEVLSLEDGQFAYVGKSYRSLTVIACKITGAHWSGPRFFGLKKTRVPSDG